MGQPAGDHGTTSGRVTNGRTASTPQPATADQGVVRLADLLEEAQRDIRRLNDERAELYGRLGFLQAQLQAKDEQLKALMAPAEPEPAAANSDGTAVPAPRWPEEPAEPDPPRPWWRFW
jgi:hypothetical protein